MIVIGGSLGGTKSLAKILKGLPESFSVPIAVVLHRHKESDESLLEMLQTQSLLRVVEVVDKDPIEKSKVNLCPADYHLLVEPDHYALSIDEPVVFARPSIDVLFQSAADVFGKDTIGIVLSGANRDGSEGAAEIRRQGGTVIVEDPATAECAVMPMFSIEQASPHYIRAADQIASLLVEISQNKESRP